MTFNYCFKVRSLILTAALSVSFSLSFPSTGRAEFFAKSWSTVNDSSVRTTTFEIKFNESPDWQADSFQIYTDINPFGPADFYHSDQCLPGCVKAIIRGAEIHSGSSELPIRRVDLSYVPTPGDGSGGWGPKIGEIPFLLRDETLSFTVPWTMLATDDGKFYYRLETFEFGGWVPEGSPGLFTSGIAYTAPPIPEPETYALMLAGLGLIGLIRRKKSEDLV
jgi:hypothetical protein